MHLCEQWGHFKPLITPPYHPELQPIEELWRDVKQSVARKFIGLRNITELRNHVLEGFLHYGTKEKSQNKINRAIAQEKRYREEDVYAPVIDLTEMSDDDTDYETPTIDLVNAGEDEDAFDGCPDAADDDSDSSDSEDDE